MTFVIQRYREKDSCVLWIRELARYYIIEDDGGKRDARDDVIVSKLRGLYLYKTDGEDRYNSHKIIAMIRVVLCFIILRQSGVACHELNSIFLSRVI